MAKALGLQVIVEGVETDRQLQLLRDLGDGMMQGFLISPALPAGEFETFCSEYASKYFRLASSS